MRGTPKSKLARQIADGDSEEKWSRTVLSLIAATCDVVLGDRGTISQLRRSATVSVFLVVTTLPLTGLLSHTFLGFSEPPWQSFDSLVDDLLTAVRKEEKQFQEGGLFDRPMLEAAKRPHWKYVYTAVATVFTLSAHVLTLWVAIRLTRRWVVDFVAARTWLQRSSLLFVFALATIFLIGAAMLFVSLVSSPATGLVIILGSAGIWDWAVGFAIAAVVLNWLGDPWFRAIAISSLLPCVGFVFLTGPALASDLRAYARNRGRTLALNTTQRALGTAGTPILIVLVTLLFFGWVLWLLL